MQPTLFRFAVLFRWASDLYVWCYQVIFFFINLTQFIHMLLIVLDSQLCVWVCGILLLLLMMMLLMLVYYLSGVIIVVSAIKCCCFCCPRRRCRRRRCHFCCDTRCYVGTHVNAVAIIHSFQAYKFFMRIYSFQTHTNKLLKLQ